MGDAQVRPTLPALDPEAVAPTIGSGYPAAFRPAVNGRAKQRLGDALGLRNFGVNLTTLAPGAGSALRHWHKTQDEFIYVLSGELTLVTETGEQQLLAGMCAGFPAGKPDGHRLVNRSGAPATYLEVGDRSVGDEVCYPDDDLEARWKDGGWQFYRKSGEPY